MSGSKSTSTSGSGQKWALPIARAGTTEVNSVYNAAKPNLDAVIEQNTALGQRLNTNLNAAGGVGKKAGKYYDSVLSGDYLNGNPWIQGVIDASSRDITDNVNSQFTSAGRYGSGAHTDVLANALAELENQLRYQNYATERGYQQDAATGSISAETARAQAQQAAAQQLLAQQAMAAELPYTGTNALASQLGTLFNGGKSVEKQGLGSSLLGAIGTIGGGAAQAGAFSDPALKENVVKIGEEPDGLGWYEYSLLGSDERELGVMATEVAELRPWALGPLTDGYMTVNYEKLEAA